MMVTVEVDRLTKCYGTLTALHACSFTIAQGEVLGLLGPNGAGKTTLIRLLTGFLRPTSGTATILGRPVARDDVATRLQLAYLPGDARLPRTFSGREVLEMWSGFHPAGDFDRAKSIASRLDLDTSRRVGMMSTGMRQKLALAVTLSIDAPLLILDEPTANLDPSVRGEVLLLVREAKARGQTILFSNHVLSEIEETCDRVAILKQGSLVGLSSMEQLRDRYRIEATVPQELADRHFKQDARLIELVSQGRDARLVLDARGDLAEILRLLSETHPHDLRIEPIGLRAEYERAHGNGKRAAR